MPRNARKTLHSPRLRSLGGALCLAALGGCVTPSFEAPPTVEAIETAPAYRAPRPASPGGEQTARDGASENSTGDRRRLGGITKCGMLAALSSRPPRPIATRPRSPKRSRLDNSICRKTFRTSAGPLRCACANAIVANARAANTPIRSQPPSHASSPPSCGSSPDRARRRPDQRAARRPFDIPFMAAQRIGRDTARLWCNPRWRYEPPSARA